jgi:hypothetical protein
MSVETGNYFNTITYGDVVEKVAYNSQATLANAPQVEAGKVFVGWKDLVSGELYKAGETITVNANKKFEAVAFTFNTFGASLRIDTESETSGLRFITNYNAEELEAIGMYVQEFGTIIAKTASLAGKDFVLENFTIGTDIAKVANTKDHFETEEGMAYSAALINIKPANIDQEFSARGYMVVEYHDGTTATIYTDYSAENNSRSVQGVAQALKAYMNGAFYNSLDTASKAVIDGFAN